MVRTVIIIALFFLTYFTPVQVAYETENVASFHLWDTKYRLSYLHAFQSALFCFHLDKRMFLKFFFLIYYNMHHGKLVLMLKHWRKHRLHRWLILYMETPFQLFPPLLQTNFSFELFLFFFFFFPLSDTKLWGKFWKHVNRWICRLCLPITCMFCFCPTEDKSFAAWLICYTNVSKTLQIFKFWFSTYFFLSENKICLSY